MQLHLLTAAGSEHRTQRPRVTMSATTQLGIALLADRIMLDGDPCPLIERVLQARLLQAWRRSTMQLLPLRRVTGA